MKILRTFKRGVATVVALDDPLMDEVASSLRANAEEELSKRNLHIVVDLGSVPFIDSVGLETLLDLSAAANEAGGAFCVASPSELCRDILKATRLNNAVVVYPTVDEACRSFL